MKLSKTLVALAFASTTLLSTQAMAETQSNNSESAIQRIVSVLVSNAVQTASEEIDIQLEKITLTATHLIDVEPTQNIATKVTITDLSSKEETKGENTGENTNQIESNDD